MKIITGTAKGMNLETLEGEVTRPTSQRVKEAIFSMLQFDIEGANVLDLFAGSGQMGLEALSRGAEKATFCDISRDAIGIISKNVKKTHFYEKSKILNYHYAQSIRKIQGEKFDIIFIDPPYNLKCIEDAIKKLNEENLISSNAFIVCESGEENILNDEDIKSKFLVYKKSKYSISYITILRPNLEK